MNYYNTLTKDTADALPSKIVLADGTPWYKEDGVPLDIAAKVGWRRIIPAKEPAEGYVIMGRTYKQAADPLAVDEILTTKAQADIDAEKAAAAQAAQDAADAKAAEVAAERKAITDLFADNQEYAEGAGKLFDLIRRFP